LCFCWGRLRIMREDVVLYMWFAFAGGAWEFWGKM
jgi:hypothetical protein